MDWYAAHTATECMDVSLLTKQVDGFVSLLTCELIGQPAPQGVEQVYPFHPWLGYMQPANSLFVLASLVCS